MKRQIKNNVILFLAIASFSNVNAMIIEKDDSKQEDIWTPQLEEELLKTFPLNRQPSLSPASEALLAILNTPPNIQYQAIAPIPLLSEQSLEYNAYETRKNCVINQEKTCHQKKSDQTRRHIRRYFCEPCKKVLDYARDLEAHLKLHMVTPKILIYCSACCKKFEGSPSYAAHRCGEKRKPVKKLSPQPPKVEKLT